MVSRNNFFCSDLSRGVNESIFGTASRGQVWLLLEYPKPWGEQALRDSNLASELKYFLNHFLESNHGRILFIQKESKQRNDISLFLAVAREQHPLLYSFGLDSYVDILGIDLQSIIDGNSRQKPLDPSQSLYLACTDGQHDKCCSKYGFPIYQTLTSYDASATWQSSHVGGDRFAPNLVCFPHGVFYGHLTEGDLGPIQSHYSHRRLQLSKYRGRSCFSFPIQAAEYFIREETGILDLDRLFFLRSSRLTDNHWQVEFASVGGESVFKTELAAIKSNSRNFLRCNSSERETVTQYQMNQFIELRRDDVLPVS